MSDKLITGTVAILLIAAGSWYVLTDRQQEQDGTFPQGEKTMDAGAATETSNIPADWVTYRNEEWGLEMKLPPEWTIEESRRTEEQVRASGGIGHVGLLTQINIKGEDYHIAINYNSGLAGHQEKPSATKRYIVAGQEVEVKEYDYESGFSQWFNIGKPGDSYQFRISNRIANDMNITDMIISAFKLF